MLRKPTKNYIDDDQFYYEESRHTCTGFDPRKIYMLGEKDSGLKPRGFLQKYELLKSYCLERHTLFEDPQFAPMKVEMGEDFTRLASKVKWLRPKDIVENPVFVEEGEDRFDVNQGDLGDCWFLAALANVTENHKLLELIVPVDQDFGEEYAGIFHFRLWQYGRWIDIVVDDRLPTIDGKLIYLRSKYPNVFWTPLLEKAYAKLYGSYKNIEGGFISEALEDLTGGLNEVYQELSKNEKFFNFFDMMLIAFSKQSFMGCAITDSTVMEGERTDGLYTRHAYSITDIAKVTSTIGNIYKLLRIRNPWGTGEWTGNWSDNSKSWDLLPIETKNSLLVSRNDGEFWMQYEEFVETYTLLEFCHLNPDILKNGQERMSNWWKCFMMDGSWVANISNGGLPNNRKFFKNPQYVINLNGPEKNKNYRIVIGLMQKNRRVYNLEQLPIGFAIYRLTTVPENSKLGEDFFTAKRALFTRPPEPLKQVTGHVDLTNGTYCIMPFTDDLKSSCEYLLRVFADVEINIKEIDKNVGLLEQGQMSTRDAVDGVSADTAIKEVFNSFAGEDKEINWKDLKGILDLLLKAEKETFSVEICRSMVALGDSDRSGKLNFNEFYHLWEYIGMWRGIFKNYDSDTSNGMSPTELQAALKSAKINVNDRILKMLLLRYANESGELEMQDFLHCCVKLNVMIDIYNSKREREGTLEDWLMETIYT